MTNIDYSIILSILAICGSVFTYFKHDRKIRNQEKLINSYNLEKINEEKLKEKQAIIRGSLIKMSKGHRVLRIFNKGKASAQNVRLIVRDDPEFSFTNNPCPFPVLNESENIDLNLQLHKGSPDVIHFEILWDDDYKADNSYVQTVSLI